MKESKIELTHRLQKEGRWSEASKFKDERIALHRSEGNARQAASLAAWQEMEDKFPPIEVSDENIEPQAMPQDWPEETNIDYVRDVEWVYSHLVRTDSVPADAPSSGAWSLLQWAKRNKDRFFEQTMPKALAQKKKDEEVLQCDLGEYNDNLDEVYKIMSDFKKQFDDSLIENTTEGLQREINRIVVDWRQRFRIDIPDNARESLATNFIQLADRVIQAVAENPESFMNNPSGV